MKVRASYLIGNYLSNDHEAEIEPPWNFTSEEDWEVAVGEVRSIGGTLYSCRMCYPISDKKDTKYKTSWQKE